MATDTDTTNVNMDFNVLPTIHVSTINKQFVGNIILSVD